MSKRAVVRKERELEPASEEEMVKRRRVIEMLREQMAVPPTEEDLELWQEFKASIEKGR
ncbi:MAG TPA: hypothetical protein VFR31_15895 [Thermoanaerobaculia bacterium]|nr:hypothetical protein [Thermoanaerobaculia bacterium]